MKIGTNNLYSEELNVLEKNKVNVEKLLEKVLKTKIKNIEFDGIKELKSITEYDFSIYKIIVTYEDYVDKIYFKFIKGGKIKETIFCYWSLLYEEYLEEKESNNNEFPKKTIITQNNLNQYDNSILLTLQSNMNYNAEINLVELENITYAEDSDEWLRKLSLKNENILFIGRRKLLKND